MNSKENAMDKKGHVIVKENGMMFVFGDNSENCGCDGCPAAIGDAFEWCGTKYPNTGRLCETGRDTFRCTSATKIEDGAKVYGSWNRDDALYLVNKEVEWLGGTDGTTWIKNRLQCVDHTGSPFYFGTFYASIIREIKPETITLTEARRRFNIPDNVFIDGE